MTTTVTPPEVRLDQDPMRILTIAANLLPTEITDARREGKLRKLLIVALVVLLVLLVGWDVAARRSTSAASSSLKKAQATTQKLEQSQGNFVELTNVKAASKAITAELKTLMALDLPWYTLLPNLVKAVPAGVSVTNINANLDNPKGVGTGTTGSAPSLPGITSPTEIGSITITGAAATKAQLAAYLDSLSKVDGVADVYFNSAVQSGAVYQYILTVELTSAVLGGRYSTSTTSNTGGH